MKKIKRKITKQVLDTSHPAAENLISINEAQGRLIFERLVRMNYKKKKVRHYSGWRMKYLTKTTSYNYNGIIKKVVDLLDDAENGKESVLVLNKSNIEKIKQAFEFFPVKTGEEETLINYINLSSTIMSEAIYKAGDI